MSSARFNTMKNVTPPKPPRLGAKISSKDWEALCEIKAKIVRLRTTRDRFRSLLEQRRKILDTKVQNRQKVNERIEEETGNFIDIIQKEMKSSEINTPPPKHTRGGRRNLSFRKNHHSLIISKHDMEEFNKKHFKNRGKDAKSDSKDSDGGSDAVNNSSRRGKFTFSIGSTVPVRSSTEREFTSYLVTVSYPNMQTKTILRRFRQFVTLHNAVSKRFPDLNLPHFPKKRLMGNLSNTLVEKRRQKLEVYLHFVSSLAGIEDFLAFQTFLGGDLRQRGIKKKKRKHMFSMGSTQDSSDSDFSDDDDYLTPEEREKVLNKEKRILKVEGYLRLLDSSIEKLKAIERCFQQVQEKEDFIPLSEYSKLVVQIGRHLENRDPEPDLVAKDMTQEQAAKIKNPRIRSIRMKMTPAIAEIISKLSMLKGELLNIDMPDDVVQDLMELVKRTDEIVNSVSLVVPVVGYKIESGTASMSRDNSWKDFIPENAPWYKMYFHNQEHMNYLASDGGSHIVVSVKEEAESKLYRLIIRSKDGNNFHTVTTERFAFTDWRENYEEIIWTVEPKLREMEAEFVPLDKPGLQQAFINYETRDMRLTKKFKFGIVLCKKGQTKEEEMFTNQQGSADYTDFLNIAGKTIDMSKNFSGYTGGLSLEKETGQYSVYALWRDFEVMYHVSTMLPQSDDNAQQVHKKRHIGNDIVVVIFQEAGSLPFHPTTVKSNYIRALSYF